MLSLIGKGQIIYWDVTFNDGKRLIYDLVKRNKTGNKELTEDFINKLRESKNTNKITNSIILK